MTKSDQAKFDAIESEVRQLRHDNAELTRLCALFKSNSLRKEGVIQALQRKVEGKPERAAREPSAMRAKLDAAKAEAMASGRVVTV